MQENSVFSVLNAVNCNEHVEKGEEGSESCFETFRRRAAAAAEPHPRRARLAI